MRRKIGLIRSHVFLAALLCGLAWLNFGCAGNVYHIAQDFRAAQFTALQVLPVMDQSYLASLEEQVRPSARVASEAARLTMDALLKDYAKKWKPGSNRQTLVFQVMQVPTRQQESYPKTTLNGVMQNHRTAGIGTLTYEVWLQSGSVLMANFFVQTPWQWDWTPEQRALAVRETYGQIVRFMEENR